MLHGECRHGGAKGLAKKVHGIVRVQAIGLCDRVGCEWLSIVLGYVAGELVRTRKYGGWRCGVS